MNMTKNVRKLCSALLVGLFTLGWILVNRYAPPALHWLVISMYTGVILAAPFVLMLVAFWKRLDWATLLVSIWSFAMAAGSLVLYYVASDPLATELSSLGNLRWVFLFSGVTGLAVAFLFFGHSIDAKATK
jgi:hypothetical protein